MSTPASPWSQALLPGAALKVVNGVAIRAPVNEAQQDPRLMPKLMDDLLERGDSNQDTVQEGHDE